MASSSVPRTDSLSPSWAVGVLTRDQVRQLDRRAIEHYQVPSLVLMENAGRGCAACLVRAGIRGTVLICCGKGNNAGDGFVVARHLDALGYPVRVWYWDDPAEFSADAAANFRIAQHAGIPLERMPADAPEVWSGAAREVDWCVDALLGTGARGDPRPPYAHVIRWMNQFAARRCAVDLPSGLDCDTGEPADPTVRADLTCTFVAWKRGFLNPAAQPYLGKIIVVPIGVPGSLLKEFRLARAVRERAFS